MTPVTFDTFRDTHPPPARTNANFPARSRSGLDHEKEVKYDTVTLSIEDTCLTFLIGGTSLFTFIARGTGTQKRSGTPLFFVAPLPGLALPSTNVEVRTLPLENLPCWQTIGSAL